VAVKNEHKNKETNRREKEHSLFPYVCRLSVENNSTKHDKYVINQELEHVDDITFLPQCKREAFICEKNRSA
jgi:hypothetical protein